MNARNEDTQERLREIGKSAYESIAEMVAALEVDYDRLEELRDEKKTLIDAVSEAAEERAENPCEDTERAHHEAVQAERAWRGEYSQELRELEDAAGDCESREDAYERIQEDPLSLEVRSGWHAPGEEVGAEEFCLLLGTGGPAVRIIGELSEHGEPKHATLQTQDWFTPWTDYLDVDQSVLLTYCQQFYFGD